jgi:hypothetical protein
MEVRVEKYIVIPLDLGRLQLRKSNYMLQIMQQ